MNKENIEILLPQSVQSFMERITLSGHEVFVVGGFVRDSLLGGNSDDVDFTTNMLPDEIITLFCDCEINLRGIKHGTVRVIYENCEFEITTYRIDLDYCDNRHPNEVLFSSSLHADLSRRDLTINALCYNLQSGLIDDFGGIDDMRNHIIRCIGDPRSRFNEDALRILRVFRFAAQLDFSIEKNTLDAAIEFAQLLKNISRERKTMELLKLMNAKKPSSALTYMNEVLKDFIDGFVPVTDELISNIDNVPISDICFSVRFTILFLGYDFSKYNINNFFAISKKKIFQIEFLRKNGNVIILSESKKQLKRLLAQYGIGKILLLFNYQKAMSLLKSPVKNVQRALEEIIELKECYCLKDLAIKGRDIIGFPNCVKGKRVKIFLNNALNAVISGKVKNERQEILEYLNLKS